MPRLLLLLLFIGCAILTYPPGLSAQQRDTLVEPVPDLSQTRLEDFLNNTDEEGEFDFNTTFENLEIYRRHPLDLNRATQAMLEELGLLNDVQIANLLTYRQQLGELISLYELQAIPAFDLASVRRLLPFVRVGGGLDDFQVPLRRMLADGNNELYLRWSRVLEPQRGYTQPTDATNRYLGDPNQFYIRFRHTYSNRMSFGFTAEKDRGEEFFRGSNRQGFDFYSAHWFLRDYSQRLRALALGDYTASFGQGLILFTGFGYGKSTLTTSVKRGGRTLRPYSSVNEASFLRGAAATVAITPELEFTGMVSYRRRDANALQPDTTDTGEALPRVSSLDIDGFHRTAAEIEDRGALGYWLGGGSLKWQKTAGHIAFNTIYHQLDKSLTLTPQPYNQFFFQGQHLLNLSVDYAWRWRNLSFFGETASSDNGAIATLNGLLLGLDRRVDLAVLYRHFPRHFQSLLADPFAETAGGRNEAGLYMGVEIRPHRYWVINAFFDTWQHPWLRFTADAPSRGHEWRFRLTYFRKRSLDTYLEIRSETKEANLKIFDSNLDAVLPGIRFQARLHLAVKLSPALEWRSRIDWGYADNPINNRQTGTGIYQDLLFRPISSPWIFSTRFALFDTDGYQVRFYNFENGLLYNFAIPAYYNQGSRFYLNVRYKGIRNLTLEARFAQLYWADQPSVGSGLDATGRPTRSEVSAQVKYQF